MAQTHLEKLIDDKITESKDAMVNITIGDSHKHAQLKGYITACKDIKELARQAARTDVEETL